MSKRITGAEIAELAAAHADAQVALALGDARAPRPLPRINPLAECALP